MNLRLFDWDVLMSSAKVIDYIVSNTNDYMILQCTWEFLSALMMWQILRVASPVHTNNHMLRCRFIPRNLWINCPNLLIQMIQFLDSNCQTAVQFQENAMHASTNNINSGESQAMINVFSPSMGYGMRNVDVQCMILRLERGICGMTYQK